MSIKINLSSNADEVSRAMKKKPKQVGFHMAIAIKKSAFLVEQFAKEVTPYRFGTLQRSIASDIYPTIATIAPHTNYAVFVHEGTRYMTGRPFMKRGYKMAQAQIRRVFSKELKKALK